MKHKVLLSCALVLVLAALAACQFGGQEAGAAKLLGPEGLVAAEGLAPNPAPGDMGPPPPSAAPRWSPPPARMALEALSAEPATLEPAAFEAALGPGQSVSERKVATLPADVLPPKGDILVSFDLTGSMAGELAKVKLNAQDIADAVRASIADADFGVVSHMDYPSSYPYDPAKPDYLTAYGSAIPYPPPPATPVYTADYAYRLDQPIGADTAAFQAAIGALCLGQGSDGPEDYGRVLYESYADPGIGWREGSKKIVLAWLDSIPHDYDYAEIIDPALNNSTGPDPGRDERIGPGFDGDNLAILDVLAGMKAHDLTLIALFSGAGYLPLWQAYAAATGGAAFQINADGSIPSGTPIADFVADQITEEARHIDKLELAAEAGYEAWFSASPASYADIDLGAAQTFDFDVSYAVPLGTPGGEYHFKVNLVGDGAIYASQEVSLTVQGESAVSLDIKPGSWPNPLNVGSSGVVPIAIAGGAGLDASRIDPASLRLEGVPALRWGLEDVTAPLSPYLGKPLDGGAALQPDGVPDLTAKFDTAALAAALGAPTDGQVMRLRLTGSLLDGTPIVGEDLVRIINKK